MRVVYCKYQIKSIKNETLSITFTIVLFLCIHSSPTIHSLYIISLALISFIPCMGYMMKILTLPTTILFEIFTTFRGIFWIYILTSLLFEILDIRIL